MTAPGWFNCEDGVIWIGLNRREKSRECRECRRCEEYGKLITRLVTGDNVFDGVTHCDRVPLLLRLATARADRLLALWEGQYELAMAIFCRGELRAGLPGLRAGKADGNGNVRVCVAKLTRFLEV
jgi:hypothetical protein